MILQRNQLVGCIDASALDEICPRVVRRRQLLPQNRHSTVGTAERLKRWQAEAAAQGCSRPGARSPSLWLLHLDLRVGPWPLIAIWRYPLVAPHPQVWQARAAAGDAPAKQRFLREVDRCGGR